MSDPTTRNVASQYGAPMGRHAGTSDATSCPPRSVRLFRVRIDSQGYDAGGAYWGIGAPLWCATDEEDFEEYVRAGTRAHAAHLLGIGGWQLKLPIPQRQRIRHAEWLATFKPNPKESPMTTATEVLAIGAFDKWVLAGRGVRGEVFVSIRWDGKRLSISGVEGPKRNGDALGSCGQCVDALVGLLREDVDAAKLRDIWERWHLNDMRVACEHQRADDWGSETLEIVTYGLTSEAWVQKRAAEAECIRAASAGEVANLSATGRALIAPDWFRDRFAPPDADDALSGCYEVRKRETKTAGWVYPTEHPRGVFTKPCPACGHKYGSAWLMEKVPADVIAWLRALPASDACPWRL
mgnify:CR=1 FL=1